MVSIVTSDNRYSKEFPKILFKIRSLPTQPGFKVIDSLVTKFLETVEKSSEVDYIRDQAVFPLRFDRLVLD